MNTEEIADAIARLSLPEVRALLDALAARLAVSPRPPEPDPWRAMRGCIMGEPITVNPYPDDRFVGPYTGGGSRDIVVHAWGAPRASVMFTLRLFFPRLSIPAVKALLLGPPGVLCGALAPDVAARLVASLRAQGVSVEAVPAPSPLRGPGVWVE